MHVDARALLLFFLVACIPPWIGWSLITFGVVPQNAPYAPLLYITGWGCSAGGLIATYASEGRAGFRRLLREAVRVRVPARWWLYVLLIPPAMQTCAALLYFVFARVPVAIHPVALLSLATPGMLLPFLFGPFGEEFGWRGFLLPQFVRRFSVLPACLLVGIIEALWHWPLEYNVMGGLLWVAICGSFMIGAVYLRTQSVLLAMIFHWNFNSMTQLSAKLFPGVPALGSTPWEAVGVMTLFAALTIPALIGQTAPGGAPRSSLRA
jgi:membrane protease YdiL (CAAX protease family)